MSQAKATDFPLLLEVFREGLLIGLISREDVVGWADNIINNENEPDYFFIEISLSQDINAVAEVLDQHVSCSKSPILLRVLMGLIYKKLNDDDSTMTVEEAAILLGRTNNRDVLTSFECNKIYSFEDYEFCYLPDLTQLQIDITQFLSIYKEFTLYNYEQWPEINTRVEVVLNEEKAKSDVICEANRKFWERKASIKRMWTYAAIGQCILVAIFIAIVYYKLIKGAVGEADDDLYETCLYLGVFEFYCLIRVAYILCRNVWKKRY